MGRNAGYLALYVGLAVGATAVLIPEGTLKPEHLFEKIREARLNGRTHHMIVVAEGVGDSAQIAKNIKEEMSIDVRHTVLGHIQRGGKPSARDRLMATQMGYHAVELLAQGQTNRIVCANGEEICDIDIDEGLAQKKVIDPYQFKVLQAMTR